MTETTIKGSETFNIGNERYFLTPGKIDCSSSVLHPLPVNPFPSLAALSLNNGEQVTVEENDQMTVEKE